MSRFLKLVVALLLVSSGLYAQDGEIDRLMKGELKMTFPSIYFKHNSTEYAKMPYTPDSCYKYIAKHFKDDVTEMVIWRDSAETEELTKARIEILKAGLRKHLRKRRIEIESMGEQQKVSRQTMHLTTDTTKLNYLLSLNSVMDFSNTNYIMKKNKGDHVMHPKITCIHCWAHCFHIVERHKRKKKAREKLKGRS